MYEYMLLGKFPLVTLHHIRHFSVMVCEKMTNCVGIMNMIICTT